MLINTVKQLQNYKEYTRERKNLRFDNSTICRIKFTPRVIRLCSIAGSCAEGCWRCAQAELYQYFHV